MSTLTATPTPSLDDLEVLNDFIRVFARTIAADPAVASAALVAIQTEVAARKYPVSEGHQPPIECAPWCRDGDGHPRETHAVDQVCRGEFRTITPNFGVVNGYQTAFEVSACRGFGRKAAVNFHLDLPGIDIDEDFDISAADARDLAAALIATANEIDGGR